MVPKCFHTGTEKPKPNKIPWNSPMSQLSLFPFLLLQPTFLEVFSSSTALSSHSFPSSPSGPHLSPKLRVSCLLSILSWRQEDSSPFTHSSAACPATVHSPKEVQHNLVCEKQNLRRGMPLFQPVQLLFPITPMKCRLFTIEMCTSQASCNPPIFSYTSLGPLWFAFCSLPKSTFVPGTVPLPCPLSKMLCNQPMYLAFSVFNLRLIATSGDRKACLLTVCLSRASHTIPCT